MVWSVEYVAILCNTVSDLYGYYTHPHDKDNSVRWIEIYLNSCKM